MKNYMALKKIFLVGIVLVGLCLSAKAQTELSSIFMGSQMVQSANYNPAEMNQYKLNVHVIPSINAGYYNRGFKASSFLRQEGTIFRLNLEELIATVKDKGIDIQAGGRIETLGVGLTIDKWSVRLQHAINSYNSVHIPDSSLDFLLSGNGNYIGQTANIGVQVNSLTYSELGVQVAHDLNEQLNIGIGIKYLSGIAAVQTVRSELDVYTNPEYYQLEFTADYLLNTAGVSGEQSSSGGLGSILFGPNKGWSFDFGATYQVDESLKIGASFMNIGSISWQEDVRSYKSYGDYSFDGIDVGPLLENDKIDFEANLDSLEASFEVEEYSARFRTATPQHINLYGTYQLENGFQLGLLYRLQGQFSNNLHAFAINVKKDLGNIFSIGTQYAYLAPGSHNIGLNAMLTLKPVQLFFMTDNIAGVFDVLGSRQANFRVGVNLVFGGSI